MKVAAEKVGVSQQTLHADMVGDSLIRERQGQLNGLCGAVLPGRISMMTGLRAGNMQLTLEWLPDEPLVIDDSWDDVVEVSFDIEDGSDLVLSSFQDVVPVRAPGNGPHRVRYCASGMDAGRAADTSEIDSVGPDRYLLQLVARTCRSRPDHPPDQSVRHLLALGCPKLGARRTRPGRSGGRSSCCWRPWWLPGGRFPG